MHGGGYAAARAEANDRHHGGSQGGDDRDDRESAPNLIRHATQVMASTPGHTLLAGGQLGLPSGNNF
ncbi:hypothetical protein GCM10010172_52690 [Paractinoplanes ferrugineus]|uniref:Uncharacterized protein n=1 Tax=Paractinoplanes ferrugineus TaxID=113564 RepID=A0A919ML70_9ACTN|nr:hypothetical protein Afe05nite_37520 [Actinoplanes ferrugineus]